ncbi:MAG: 5-methyltetrahydropteroyltriglutamate--homocysteine S-methyltransferase [Spirochaetales bacterium]|nr:5-methyltetrahydropteroyltriglutamate--homocysteine S-methyltransferase [Spirochaetales bacterium]
MRAHAAGWPKIGPNREWKKALEGYWRGELDARELADREEKLRRVHLTQQIQAGLDVVTLDFSRYDPVLEVLYALGRVPLRFASLAESERPLDRFLALARGHADKPAMALRKWFGTNYHQIVPEWDALKPAWAEDFSFFVRQVRDAHELRQKAHLLKLVLPGPATVYFSGNWTLGFPTDQGQKEEFQRSLGQAYARLAGALGAAGVDWIQWDEPWFVTGERQDGAVLRLYEGLSNVSLPQLGACPYGRVDDQLDLLIRLPWSGLHIDAAASGHPAVQRCCAIWPRGKLLSIGAVDGRSPWVDDPAEVHQDLVAAQANREESLVWLGSSCTLAHLPYDLETEPEVPSSLRPSLAFALQKAQLTARLAHSEALAEHFVAKAPRPEEVVPTWSKRQFTRAERQKIQTQALALPPFPTTTIGSFPQTEDLRRDRRSWIDGKLTKAEYDKKIEERIREAIAEQEALGLDVLVHGEFERTDMVEYFAQNLEGFWVTRNGWVQSYGTRCVRPPLITGAIRRTRSMTEGWLEWAQKLTLKPVKGMLTGPLTLLKWSFARPSSPLAAQAGELAQAVAQEVSELQSTGLKIIQVDEPGFREGLPLRPDERAAYWQWSIAAFNQAVSLARPETQIHTHMCYADFDGLWDKIDALDADVISLEASRGGAEWIARLGTRAADWGLGLGVWDVHSPEIPDESRMDEILEAAQKFLDAQLWVNPDCGLKTRGWSETREGLRRMVNTARRWRSQSN